MTEKHDYTDAELLQKAGRLADAAGKVVRATALNISDRVRAMNYRLIDYDDAVNAATLAREGQPDD